MLSLTGPRDWGRGQATQSGRRPGGKGSHPVPAGHRFARYVITRTRPPRLPGRVYPVQVETGEQRDWRPPHGVPATARDTN